MKPRNEIAKALQSKIFKNKIIKSKKTYSRKNFKVSEGAYCSLGAS